MVALLILACAKMASSSSKGTAAQSTQGAPPAVRGSVTSSTFDLFLLGPIGDMVMKHLKPRDELEFYSMFDNELEVRTFHEATFPKPEAPVNETGVAFEYSDDELKEIKLRSEENLIARWQLAGTRQFVDVHARVKAVRSAIANPRRGQAGQSLSMPNPFQVAAQQPTALNKRSGRSFGLGYCGPGTRPRLVRVELIPGG